MAVHASHAWNLYIKGIVVRGSTEVMFNFGLAKLGELKFNANIYAQ
jgi:hypothetical protein